MGRRGATYEARLSVLVNTCYSLTVKQGFISSEDLVKESNLSSRMIREYLNDLLALNILVYTGNNQYKINYEILIEDPNDKLLMKEEETLLNKFLLSRRKSVFTEANQVQEKVETIFNKMEKVLRYPEKLSKQIQSINMINIDQQITKDLGIKEIVGNSFIEQLVTTNSDIKNIIHIGSAVRHKMETLNLNEFLTMTLSYLASSAVGMINDGQKRDEVNTYTITRPQLENLSEFQPFDRIEPFYEMFQDFPELLTAGRSIATRYLADMLHNKTIIDMLRSEWFKEKQEYSPSTIIFKKGVLSPHGFIVHGKVLSDIQKRSVNSFYDLYKEIKNKKVKLVGITTKPRDNAYFKLSTKLLDVNIGQMDDLNLFNQIMKNNQVSCIFDRRGERGKLEFPIPIYEFYTKQSNTVVKIEFISQSKRPMQDRKEVTENLLKNFSLTPKERYSRGPNTTIQADIYADKKLNDIKRIITAQFEYGFHKMFEKANENFVKDLNKEIMRED